MGGESETGWEARWETGWEKEWELCIRICNVA